MVKRREGTGESKVGLAGKVAMGDGVGREERPSKTPAYEVVQTYHVRHTMSAQPSCRMEDSSPKVYPST